MTKNIRVLFGMVIAAVEGENYLEASRAMTRVADYAEKMFMGQPEDVVAASKEYIDIMRMCADRVLQEPQIALYHFKDACTAYAMNVLIPWLKQNPVESSDYGNQKSYSS